MDFNDLNKLSSEELLKIAEHFKLYDFQKMNREELLNAIADIYGLKKNKKAENHKLVRSKKIPTPNYSFVTCMLLCLVLMDIIIFISGVLFTFLIENKPLLRWQNNSEWGDYYLKSVESSRIGYGYLAWNTISLFWTIYIVNIWIKRRVVNYFVLISAIISLGYFVLIMVEWRQNIDDILTRERYEEQIGNIAERTSTFAIYVKLFWVSVIFIPLFVLSFVSAFCILSALKIFIKNKSNL